MGFGRKKEMEQMALKAKVGPFPSNPEPPPPRKSNNPDKSAILDNGAVPSLFLCGALAPQSTCKQAIRRVVRKISSA